MMSPTILHWESFLCSLVRMLCLQIPFSAKVFAEIFQGVHWTGKVLPSKSARGTWVCLFTCGAARRDVWCMEGALYYTPQATQLPPLQKLQAVGAMRVALRNAFHYGTVIERWPGGK